MSAWYYQCSAGIPDGLGRTYEDDFRLEIREWSDVTWPGLGPHQNKAGTLIPDERPCPGDSLIVGFAITGARRPGIVAAGLVIEEREERVFRWRPIPPTSSLLLRPLWEPDVEKCLKAVRADMSALNCYELSATDEDYLLARVACWVSSGK